MNIKWRKRLTSKPFWVAVFAFIALTGQTFGIYQVPVGWDAWVNLLLSVLVAGGIIIDPSTAGIGDEDKSE